jgi:hypothetical protein
MNFARQGLSPFPVAVAQLIVRRFRRLGTLASDPSPDYISTHDQH